MSEDRALDAYALEQLEHAGYHSPYMATGTGFRPRRSGALTIAGARYVATEKLDGIGYATTKLTGLFQDVPMDPLR